MSGLGKVSILASVASSPVPKRQVLRELGVPKSTYYRWLKRLRLDDRPGGSSTPRNRLTPKEQRAVLAAALHLPELSPAAVNGLPGSPTTRASASLSPLPTSSCVKKV